MRVREGMSEVVLSVTSNFQGNNEILSLDSATPKASVRYISRQQQPPQWAPESGSEERQFFLAVLQFDLKNSNSYFRTLQKILNQGNTGQDENDTSDDWTSKLRDSFISRVRELKKTKGQMQLPLPDGRPISLRIE